MLSIPSLDILTLTERNVQLIKVANIDPSRITLNPDCGFAPGIGARVDHDEVFTKLRNQSEAARLLRAKYS
jgi:5-methyltetrahydropteroyltriglutamate--homocysteine methyltransferase